MIEPFFRDERYKNKQSYLVFLKKKQVNEFIRVKIVIILNSYNVKVIFMVFNSKM